MSFSFQPLPGERVDIKELINRVARLSGFRVITVEKISHCIFEEIISALAACRPVNIKDFGTFFIRATTPTRTFKFNPSQRLRATLGWSTTHKKR